MIFGREPVAIAAFIAIAVNLLVSFGLKLTIEQISLINGLVVLGLALIARQGSTSLAAPNLPEGTPVNNGAAVVMGTLGTTGPGTAPDDD